MTHVVGAKGQIVIAKEIRDRLGVEPGWVALQRLAGDHIEVYLVPPGHRKSLKGSLARHVKVPVAPGQEWDRGRDMAWAQAAKGKIGSGDQVS
jgi:AbrB family looped-hinge helix DNA binding protein